jgi:hypothetical protein
LDLSVGREIIKNLYANAPVKIGNDVTLSLQCPVGDIKVARGSIGPPDISLRLTAP